MHKYYFVVYPKPRALYVFRHSVVGCTLRSRRLWYFSECSWVEPLVLQRELQNRLCRMYNKRTLISFADGLYWFVTCLPVKCLDLALPSLMYFHFKYDCLNLPGPQIEAYLDKMCIHHIQPACFRLLAVFIYIYTTAAT